MDPNPEPTPAPTLDVACDEANGWQIYDGTCYKTVSTGITFDQCDAACASEGASMLCIESSSQNTFIYDILGGGWVGLTDRATEGVFEWYEGCDSSFIEWNCEWSCTAAVCGGFTWEYPHAGMQ